jgi:alcohol dehydrogenase (cytochrome c)
VRIHVSKRTLVAVLVATIAGAIVPGVAQVKTFKPVTDLVLRNPDPADWIHWRRTYDAWGYSPLNQIDKSNVGQLQLAWSWGMAAGIQQATPLVYDGIMYLANPGNVIQALDAATGELIWEHRREFPAGKYDFGDHDMMRSIQIYEDKIIFNTQDAHIVALDVHTGKVVWDTEVADTRKGYIYSSGGLIVEGKVVSGIAGCSRYGNDGCFITAHDAKTGQELWRTQTIAKPGQPGGDTWSDLPAMFRVGGEGWMTGSYDPELRLVYWGTAQAKPHAQVSRGTDGKALYTAAQLALDVDTGRIVWYHQYIPGDSQDMDEVFEPILLERGSRKVLMEMGKLGILWRLDRKTGEYLSASDIGYQNIFDLDPKTGHVSWRSGKLPQLNVKSDICPGHSGLKDWRSMSYHPDTRAFYIPLNLHCMTATYVDVSRQIDPKTGLPPTRMRGMIQRREYHHPMSGGNLGEFLAMDSDTGKVLWRHRVRTPFNSAALTTGGGLVFAGDWDRHIYAYDVRSGDILWQSRLSQSIQGFPVTYSVDGRQYIAVPVGGGGAPWGMAIPTSLAPEKRRPAPMHANALYVFALPDPKSPTPAKNQ